MECKYKKVPPYALKLARMMSYIRKRIWFRTKSSILPRRMKNQRIGDWGLFIGDSINFYRGNALFRRGWN